MLRFLNVVHWSIKASDSVRPGLYDKVVRLVTCSIYRSDKFLDARSGLHHLVELMAPINHVDRPCEYGCFGQYMEVG